MEGFAQMLRYLALALAQGAPPLGEGAGDAEGPPLPLLPAALGKASAFVAGERRDAVSVALDLAADGSLQHFRFQLSTILPTARLDAAALLALAERKPKARTTPAGLKPLKEHLPLVDNLLTVAGLLRSRRLEAGSLDLDLAMPPIDSLGDLRIPCPDAAGEGWLVQLDNQQPMALLREAVLVAHRALGRHLAALQLPGLFARNAPPRSGRAERSRQGSPCPGDPPGARG
jgi:ribonuclease R